MGANPGRGAIADQSHARRHEHDLDLARQVCAGSRAAFEKVFEAYFGPVHALVRRRCGPERAERLTEQVLSGMFAGMAAYRGEAPLAAWILAHVHRAVAEADPGR